MKFDMCGAASVLGTFRAIAEMKAQVNVVGLIAACENMPSGRATKPGDIVTSMSGQTIEVLNTDAEGRLDPRRRAHLRRALRARGGGRHRDAHRRDGDRARPRRERPVQQQRDARARAAHGRRRRLRPRLADAAVGRLPGRRSRAISPTSRTSRGRAGGSITAACFLSRFAKKYDWAHLDIAGTRGRKARRRARPGGPVPLLDDLAPGAGESAALTRKARADAPMTTIDFYTHVDDRLAVAARLVAKACGGSTAACAC